MTFDCESILKRMKDSLPSFINTTEGTFAGDILGACAQELSRIHDQEMEEMASRSFVVSATEKWLDLACADYGIERKSTVLANGTTAYESDDDLRARALLKVRSKASSGNAAHYRVWAMEVAGVTGATVVPRNRGLGTVDVFILGQGVNLCQQVKEHIDQMRPVGVDVSVSMAQPVSINVSGTVRVLHGSALAAITAEFEEQFATFLQQQLAHGNEKHVSLAQVSSILLKCGAADVSQLKLNGTAGSLILANGNYGVAAQCAFIEDVS